MVYSLANVETMSSHLLSLLLIFLSVRHVETLKTILAARGWGRSLNAKDSKKRDLLYKIVQPSASHICTTVYTYRKPNS
jgi:hypothetical protein